MNQDPDHAELLREWLQASGARQDCKVTGGGSGYVTGYLLEDEYVFVRYDYRRGSGKLYIVGVYVPAGDETAREKLARALAALKNSPLARPPAAPEVTGDAPDPLR